MIFRAIATTAIALASAESMSCVAAAQSADSTQAAPACPHGIDKAKCPFCDPSRIERLGMCKEHGVAEALCVKCKPYLEDAFIAIGDWCAEHNTPESQCALCNRSLAGDAVARAEGAGAEYRWQREPSPDCVTSSSTVLLTSQEAAAAAGFQYEQVKAMPLVHVVERNAEVAYNANAYARLSSRANGVVSEVLKDLGESVRKGDVLAVVDSTELGSAKAELLQAIEMVNLWEANARRERELLDKGVGIEREVLEAETRLAEARIDVGKAQQRLRNLGLTKDQIEAVKRDGDTSSLLSIVAPFDGTIVERTGVVGEVVEAGRTLLCLANINVMWAMVDLTEADLAVVQTGQSAVISIDGLPGRSFPGHVTWISTQIDPKTRTLKARIELDNGDGVLRANMFGRAKITAGNSRVVITIPKEAVQWEGCCNVAFVKSGEDDTSFQPARLALAFDTGDRYEVAEGLKAGDTIVTKGSFILKNEVLKNSVGAGCCEVDHLKK
jgi:cobalt-zinc-cadmium efflux system membrane fusion protein